MSVEDRADHPKMKPAVILTGTANEGCSGPPIGLVDMGESERAYIFRVALPGIDKNQNKFKCELQRDGKVCIHGAVPKATALDDLDSSGLYRMQVQQLCPPGPFTVSFKLPGPVDPRLFVPKFRPDGILEGVVAKYIGQNPTPL